MEDLKAKVTKMLEGEKKRREYAVKFLEKLSDMIKDVCMVMYGEEGNDPYIDTPAVWLKTNGERNSYIYYRYAPHYGRDAVEKTGFYYANPMKNDIPCWATPVESLHGKEFWRAIKTVVDWTKIIADDIDKRSEKRESLVERLRKI